MPRRASTLRVYLEGGDKRTFAGALDWPGWSRSGRDADLAVEALLVYAPRYAAVVSRVGLSDAPPGTDARVDIVERHAGGAGTDFGVPSAAPEQDGAPLKGRELERQLALLQASWEAFDAAARAAEGKTLSVGPRGGGRTLPKMRGHVLEAEIAYLGQLGSRPPKAAAHDEMTAVREASLATVDAIVHGRPVDNPRNTKRPWSARYFIRRSAWHALDHAWELEDRIPH